MTDYHADRTHLTSGSLRLFRANPRLFGLWLAGAQEAEETSDMIQGRALHAVMFEPFLVVTGGNTCEGHYKDGRPCTSQAKRGDSFCGKHGGVEVPSTDQQIYLTRDEHASMILAADQIRRHKINRWLDACDLKEAAYTWTCDVTGLPLKCRVDCCRRETVIDLKYFQPELISSLEKIEATIYNRGLHRQAAHYLRILKANQVVAEDAVWRWVFAEKGSQAPQVRVYRASDELLRLGEVEVMHDLVEIAQRWPDQWQQSDLDEEHVADVVGWKKRQIERGL